MTWQQCFTAVAELIPTVTLGGHGAHQSQTHLSDPSTDRSSDSTWHVNKALWSHWDWCGGDSRHCDWLHWSGGIVLLSQWSETIAGCTDIQWYQSSQPFNLVTPTAVQCHHSDTVVADCSKQSAFSHSSQILWEGIAQRLDHSAFVYKCDCYDQLLPILVFRDITHYCGLGSLWGSWDNNKTGQTLFLSHFLSHWSCGGSLYILLLWINFCFYTWNDVSSIWSLMRVSELLYSLWSSI